MANRKGRTESGQEQRNVEESQRGEGLRTAGKEQDRSGSERTGTGTNREQGQPGKQEQGQQGERGVQSDESFIGREAERGGSTGGGQKSGQQTGGQKTGSQGGQQGGRQTGGQKAAPRVNEQGPGE